MKTHSSLFGFSLVLLTGVALTAFFQGPEAGAVVRDAPLARDGIIHKYRPHGKPAAPLLAKTAPKRHRRLSRRRQPIERPYMLNAALIHSNYLLSRDMTALLGFKSKPAEPNTPTLASVYAGHKPADIPQPAMSPMNVQILQPGSFYYVSPASSAPVQGAPQSSDAQKSSSTAARVKT